MRRWFLLLSLALVGATDGPQLTLAMGHVGDILVIEVSSDGRLVVTGGADGTVRLWDATNGRELRVLGRLSGRIEGLDLSDDGHTLAAIGYSETVSVWDVASGDLLSAPKLEERARAVGISADGQRVWGATSEWIQVWDRSGTLIGEIPAESIRPMATLVPPGLLVAEFGSLALWEPGQPAPIWRQELALERNNGAIVDIAGDRIAAALVDGSVVLLDLNSGARVGEWRFPTPSGVTQVRARFNPVVKESLLGAGVHSIALSPDAGFIAVGGAPGALIVIDTRTGRKLRAWSTDVPIRNVAVTDAGLVWARDASGVVCSFDAAEGEKRCLENREDMAGHRPLLSLGGDKLAFTDAPDQVQIAAPEPVTLNGLAAAPVSVFFSPDSRGLYVATQAGGVWRWDPDGAERLAPGVPDKELLQTAFSADGRTMALRYTDCVVRELDLATHKETELGCTQELFGWRPEHGPFGSASGKTAWDLDVNGTLYPLGRPDADLEAKVRALGGSRTWLSPGDLRALYTAPDGVFAADLAGGAPVKLEYTDAVAYPSLARWSWDARLVVISSTSTGFVGVWDGTTGAFLAQLDVGGGVEHLDFSRDGRLLATVGRDGFVRLWGVGAWTELCRLALMRDGAWAVVTPEERFDTSDGDSIAGLYWVDGLSVVSSEQLGALFYAPGVLRERLAYTPIVHSAARIALPEAGDGPPEPGDRSRPSPSPSRRVAVGDLPPYPNLTLSEIGPDSRFSIALSDAGGGLGPLLVTVNGSEMFPLPEPEPGEDGALVFRVVGSDAPTWREEGQNRVVVTAWNADATLSGPPVERSAGPESAALVPPRLYAVVVGTADYTGEGLDLRFSALDAARMAEALSLSVDQAVASGWMEAGEIQLLSTAPDQEPPTRDNILAALDALSTARPDDIVVLYFSGHGVTRGSGPQSEYYYLTVDASREDELEDPARRAQISVSGAEIQRALSQTPATRRVLVLDTCAAGQMIEGLGASRDVGEAKALERMKDRTGTYVLAGAPADAVSYESTVLGQGLLTYALLSALKGPGLRDDAFVDVGLTFAYAQEQVPRLAAGMGNVQRPLLHQPPTGSFDIGELDAADRAAIPLEAPRPAIVRTMLISEAPPWTDALGLSGKVDAALAKRAEAPDATFAFVNAERFSGAWQLRGRYTVAEGVVTAELIWIDPDGVSGAPIRLQGSAAELPALIAASAPVR